MDEMWAAVKEIGPILAVFVMIAVGFVQNNRAMSHVQKITANASAGMQEAMAGSTTVLNRIAENQVEVAADLRIKLEAERENNHQKILKIMELQGIITDTALELGHKERELEDTKEALGALKQAKDTLGEQLTALSANVGTMTTKLETLEAKLSEAEEHITALEGQQKSMQSELDEARALREKAERLNQTLTEERDRLLSDNREMTGQIAQYKEEVRSLRGKLDALEKRIEGMIDVKKSEGTGDAGGIGDDAGADGSDGAG